MPRNGRIEKMLLSRGTHWKTTMMQRRPPPYLNLFSLCFSEKISYIFLSSIYLPKKREERHHHAKKKRKKPPLPKGREATAHLKRREWKSSASPKEKLAPPPTRRVRESTTTTTTQTEEGITTHAPSTPHDSTRHQHTTTTVNFSKISMILVIMMMVCHIFLVFWWGRREGDFQVELKIEYQNTQKNVFLIVCWEVRKTKKEESKKRETIWGIYKGQIRRKIQEHHNNNKYKENKWR